MNALAVMGSVIQLLLVLGGAPLLIGLMRQVRARLEGRVGPGIRQPWRDVRKQFRKETITPRGTTEVFRFAPLVLLATALLVTAVAPFVTTESVAGSTADLFVVVGLLAVGTVALALAGLDTGTAFGGMGASRGMLILALAEPTLLMAIFALSVRAESTNLAVIVSTVTDDPAQVFSPLTLLVAVALVIVIIAESGRLPVDNPATHLELTMVNEAMVLEYAGRNLALIEIASAIRLSVLLALLANLFLPWGIATTTAPGVLLLGVLALAVKVAVLGILLAIAEVFLAKLRLFRVPELLAGSFLLASLAVGASFVVA